MTFLARHEGRQKCCGSAGMPAFATMIINSAHAEPRTAELPDHTANRIWFLNKESGMANFSRSFHMKSLPFMLCIGVLSLCRLTFAQNPSPGETAIPAKSDVQISFGALKSLAGTWTGPVTTDPPNPDLDGPIQVTMRVASGGNSLVHEIAPGGVPEPTMIYLDGTA